MPIFPRRGLAGLRYPTNTGGVGRSARKRPPAARLAAWLSRNRRLAAALLLSAAAAIAVQQLTPAPLATATALAAARDLPAGTAVTDADVVRVQVPPGMVADGFLRDDAAATGKQLA